MENLKLTCRVCGDQWVPVSGDTMGFFVECEERAICFRCSQELDRQLAEEERVEDEITNALSEGKEVIVAFKNFRFWGNPVHREGVVGTDTDNRVWVAVLRSGLKLRASEIVDFEIR